MFKYTLSYIDDEEISGYCSCTEKEIAISTYYDKTESARNETFCHEFAHVLQDAFDNPNVNDNWNRQKFIIFLKHLIKNKKLQI